MANGKISNVNQLPNFAAGGGTIPLPEPVRAAGAGLPGIESLSPEALAAIPKGTPAPPVDIIGDFLQSQLPLQNEVTSLSGTPNALAPKTTTKVQGAGGGNGETVPLPINTEALAKQLTSPESGPGNANLKKVTPEGALEFFDDTLIGGKPLAGGEPPTGPQSLENAQGIPSPDLSQGGGFGEFVTSPQFRQLLAQLGLAISASRPTSFAHQLSGFANRSVESQIFNESVEELLNPSQPASGGGLPSNLALLSPDQQLAAIQMAQGVKQQARRGKSADVTDRLNTARTIDILRGDTPATKTPSSRVETFKSLPSGEVAPAGKRFRMGFNVKNGKYDILQGLIDEPKGSGSGEKGPRQLKPSELEQLQENFILNFQDEIKAGVSKIFGQDITSSAMLLDFLRTGEFRTPLDGALQALAQNPDTLQEFNKMIAESTDRLQADESLSIASEIFRLGQERQSLNSQTKGTLDGVRTSKEASK